ncbi:MAG TPA: hypothetical protein VHS08_02180, partial [Candidatus Acidoferrales bacterium]|nr:hypothetical protein [Candidatus Acidoferrales bacterium]
VGKGRRNSNKYDQYRETHERKEQLPHEEAPSRPLPGAPALTDVTFFRQNAVKQNEAHDAADVKKQ